MSFKKGKIEESMTGLKVIKEGLLDGFDRIRLGPRREVLVYYDPAYRLPLASIEATAGLDPRRADFAAWYLLDKRVVRASDFRTPRRAIYADLARVHTPAFLELLGKSETLASVFAVDPSEVPVDETLNTVRLACGGTLDAARIALSRKAVAVNLLGGFHHAAPGRSAGMCPVNDIAIAVATLRNEKMDGQVVNIDLDAHPPDGTAECMRKDSKFWLGSLSCASWETMPGVDETVLPERCGDEQYLAALSKLLSRMPKTPALAFVIAGGDVLDGDRLGTLGLTLQGARQRDQMVAEALSNTPSVWLPGGGYHRDSWKILAGTVLMLARGSHQPIPEGYDPLRARLEQVWSDIDRDAMASELAFTREDLEQSLGLGSSSQQLLLGRYNAENIEFTLHHCGILGQLQRVGFNHFKVEIDSVSPGDRVRLFGEWETSSDTEASGKHLLFECVVERRHLNGMKVLYVHWLTMRNPKAAFSRRRPRLPGQEKPGLGLSRELGEMLTRVARELGLEAVAFRPAWFHMAYAARHHFRYIDPARQGRFEAMVRDLGRLPLREITMAFSQGRVLMNGQPYTWDAEEMIFRLKKHPRESRKSIEAERSRVRFTLARA